MNILHLNTYDANGGAAIAASRLHLALLNEGVLSKMGTLCKSTDNQEVFQISSRLQRFLLPLWNRLDNLPLYFFPNRNKSVYFTPDWLPSQIHKSVNKTDANIVHLHWLSNCFISIYSLKHIRKPIVWTLHDTWSFTGGCHFLNDCDGYKKNCKSCPHFLSTGWNNPSHYLFLLKKNAYKQIQPTIVAPSHWMARKARESALLGNAHIEVIPNTINTQQFSPISKSTAKELLGLSPQRQYVLFGAMGGSRDPRKGYDLLVTALKTLHSNTDNNIELLIFGSSQLPEHQQLPYPVKCLGVLHDALSLKLVYNAADVFVCPSREDNLPNTVMESLACGTPVVGFNVGGIPDMITHEHNGCLAPAHDTNALAQSIAYVLNDDARRQHMGKAARQTVIERYTSDVVVRQYMKLYDNVLRTHRSTARSV